LDRLDGHEEVVEAVDMLSVVEEEDADDDEARNDRAEHARRVGSAEVLLIYKIVKVLGEGEALGIETSLKIKETISSVNHQRLSRFYTAIKVKIVATHP
jgi:hypothetical protein